MMSSSKQSMPLSKTANRISVAFLVLAFLGFIDASYLTAHHYIGIPLPCTILNGCDTVTTSTYSTIGPVPIAALGAVYYMTAFFLMFLYREFSIKKLLLAACILVGVAFAASAWLVYLQGFVLHSWCQYCVISALITTSLAALAFFLIRSENSQSI